MSQTLAIQLQIIKQQKRLGLMTHVVLGYPNLVASKKKILQMIAAGVDCIEMQIPFSDPIADGPTITIANQTALRHGVTVEKCFSLAKELIQQSPIPLQFIGYYNTIYRYGAEKFVNRCQRIGIAALTFPDIPIVEANYEPIYTLAKAANIPMIQLISPATTKKRLKDIATMADTMVYCVARFGVTGLLQKYYHNNIQIELKSYLQTVRQYAKLPIAVGFGISQPREIKRLRGLADMVVVGSALQNLSGSALTKYLKQLCASR